MSKRNGKKQVSTPTARELRVASAIGRAVSDHLNPQLARMTTTLERMDVGIGDIKNELASHGRLLASHGKELTSHGKKLDPLVSGSIGVGRFLALEERVTVLERSR